MDLQKRLNDLHLFIYSGVESGRVNCMQAEYKLLKQDPCLIYENKGKGSIVHSKARWTKQGEQPTKYFFNLKKRNYNHKIDKKLKRSDDKTVTEDTRY